MAERTPEQKAADEKRAQKMQAEMIRQIVEGGSGNPDDGPIQR